ncbi:DUF3299 domain-containing protein [Methylobacillus flagellatus]|uniref:Lipoprotein n=1 Tax=Methylobacillus flagellatus (strain ATCC 51484 / DSM 6875 / VKM B-1610 / KT) TaxID=265072 RepID=Q1H3G6_METFK|nr:DUF3299 domain-containing protein [Methylobacillus flagellatus]ABE48971.1 conserved hypothetical protein [Methylobacillus flagellatus KT]
MDKIFCMLGMIVAIGGHVSALAADYKVGERIGEVKAISQANPTYKTLDWDDMMPVDWDPMKSLKELDLDKLDDADPRAIEALEQMRSAWNDAPIVQKLDKQRVQIPGFVVPLDMNGTQVREFLLVPYFGACIHVPPPPSNQVIHIILPKTLPKDQQKTLDLAARQYGPISVSGLMETVASNTSMGFAGYRIKAERLMPYKLKEN